jgi:hypothetical protein
MDLLQDQQSNRWKRKEKKSIISPKLAKSNEDAGRLGRNQHD